MNSTIISVIAVLLYLTAGLLLVQHLVKRTPAQTAKTRFITLGIVAILLHALSLYQNLFTATGLNFGFFNVVSLLSWLIALILLVTAFTKPVENLGVAIFPLAAIAILCELIFPFEHILSGDNNPNLKIHILISIVAYSMLSVAAVQAILLAIQDKHLHNKHPGGFIRALPPLQTMETLLFQMITVGFILQSLSLVSGFMFLEDMFAQHLAHKTILSMIAWVVFATLLWGKWRFGWRGQTVIRWTLGGFVSLLLAYLGSKLVLEIMLGH